MANQQNAYLPVGPEPSNSIAPMRNLDPAAEANPPWIGNCRMDECSWSRTMSTSRVRADANGRLLRVSLLGGSSRHTGGRYPRVYSPAVPIRWNDQPHEVYVFCSTALPVVMLQDGNAYQVDILDFAGGSIPNVLTSSAELYTHICHPGADWTDARFARRFGYVRSPPEGLYLNLPRPEDIFENVGYLDDVDHDNVMEGAD